MNKETITEVIALLNTANYNIDTLNNKRDEVVHALKKQLSIYNVSCSRRVSNEKLNDKTYESLNRVEHKNEDTRQGYFRGFKNGAIWMRKQYEK